MKKLTSTHGIAVALMLTCFIGLAACSGSTESTYEQYGLEVPRHEGDTLYLNSGVRFTYFKKGNGPMIDSLAAVKTHINLIVGQDTVWSTYAPGQNILGFTAKKTSLIDGFDEVVMYLKEGDHILAVIPSDQGYGPNDYGGGLIPGGSTLHFDMEIIEVQPLDTAAVSKP